MSYLDDYCGERRWINRIMIMYLYHLHQLLSNPKHRVEDTAMYFHKSKALVSENLKLAKYHDLVENCNSREEAIYMLKGMK